MALTVRMLVKLRRQRFRGSAAAFSGVGDSSFWDRRQRFWGSATAVSGPATVLLTTLQLASRRRPLPESTRAPYLQTCQKARVEGGTNRHFRGLAAQFVWIGDVVSAILQVVSRRRALLKSARVRYLQTCRKDRVVGSANSSFGAGGSPFDNFAACVSPKTVAGVSAGTLLANLPKGDSFFNSSPFNRA